MINKDPSKVLIKSFSHQICQSLQLPHTFHWQSSVDFFTNLTWIKQTRCWPALGSPFPGSLRTRVCEACQGRTGTRKWDPDKSSSSDEESLSRELRVSVSRLARPSAEMLLPAGDPWNLPFLPWIAFWQTETIYANTWNYFVNRNFHVVIKKCRETGQTQTTIQIGMLMSRINLW